MCVVKGGVCSQLVFFLRKLLPPAASNMNVSNTSRSLEACVFLFIV